MSTRFQQLALILGAATVIFLGSRVCSRLLAQAPPPPVPGDDYTQPAQPGGGDQAPAGSQTGPEVLTRGPIHEAFAEVVSYNPQPGQIVSKEPPKAIEEVPPAEKPEGDYTWIPGYWAWDQDRENFIWVTGAWRIPPPGTTWVPGYWNQAANGHQWVGGYWGPAANTATASESTSETVYLPTPPQSVESGASTPAPSPDHFWVPGYWYWVDGQYVWRAGYWGRCQPDWVWIPARYVWTPGGYVFLAGHWDYALAKRGVVFCPVYFANAVLRWSNLLLHPKRLHRNPGVDGLFVLPSGLLPLLFRRLLRSDVRAGGHLSVVCGPRGPLRLRAAVRLRSLVLRAARPGLGDAHAP